MIELEEELRTERRNLLQALDDIEAEEAAGQIQGDRESIKELIILRIAEIDLALGEKPN